MILLCDLGGCRREWYLQDLVIIEFGVNGSHC